MPKAKPRLTRNGQPLDVSHQIQQPVTSINDENEDIEEQTDKRSRAARHKSSRLEGFQEETRKRNERLAKRQETVKRTSQAPLDDEDQPIVHKRRRVSESEQVGNIGTLSDKERDGTDVDLYDNNSENERKVTEESEDDESDDDTFTIETTETLSKLAKKTQAQLTTTTPAFRDITNDDRVGKSVICYTSSFARSKNATQLNVSSSSSSPSNSSPSNRVRLSAAVQNTPTNSIPHQTPPTAHNPASRTSHGSAPVSKNASVRTLTISGALPESLPNTDRAEKEWRGAVSIAKLRTDLAAPPKGNHMRTIDFEKEARPLILLAAKYYRVIIATENPWPDRLEQEQLATEAWLLACQDYKSSMKAIPQVYEVIRQRGSQLRSELKTYVRTMVEMHYGFASSSTTEEQEATGNRVRSLLTRNTLAYRDPEGRKGLYENPLILKAIEKQWFKDENAEGPTFHVYFNPIPLPTIALVLTVIESCIKEWSCGILSRNKFTEKEFKVTYIEHLATLQRWNSHKSGQYILPKLQLDLHNKARAASRAGDIDEEAVIRLDDDDFDAAAEESLLDASKSTPTSHDNNSRMMAMAGRLWRHGEGRRENNDGTEDA